MGEALADVIHGLNLEGEIDVVIPVPDTARTAASELATKLNKPYREGFIKNRYIGRTFIMPGQSLRKKAVRRKLNVMKPEFNGKSVVLVDGAFFPSSLHVFIFFYCAKDSIVRGTTSKEIIQMAREAGATKVYFASCSPPIRFPNVYGIDMPTVDELVAHGRTEAEIATEIGADAVIYLVSCLGFLVIYLFIFQPLDKLIECCQKCNPEITSFDCSVFTGEYVTKDVTKEYLENLRSQRNDSAQSKSRANGHADVIGLHNFTQI